MTKRHQFVLLIRLFAFRQSDRHDTKLSYTENANLSVIYPTVGKRLHSIFNLHTFLLKSGPPTNVRATATMPLLTNSHDFQNKGIKMSMTMLASGLQYEDVQVGSGDEAKSGAHVT